ncbi:sensor domain-containing diguanylate cyclase [Nocardia jiangxiensis]|uniref:sensor domain-containing diguanylate cyclase n=1 Tax=Nocardia jiangxiensis TaxID=282685 RepID=UPI0002E5CD91|nr:sensor domain-containing diguanylate cyclase [Nocardia jiangxiensis]
MGSLWPHAVDTAQRQSSRAGDERFRIVFDNAAIAIAIADTAGTLLEVNPGLAAMIGVSAEELRGTSVYRFAHPDARGEICTLVFDTLVPAREGTVKLEQQFARTDGSTGWAAFAITYVKGSADQADYLLAVGEDVTDRHQLHAELHRQVRHDVLTGLPNRRHFLEQLETLTATATDHDRIGLCFVDLDGFKQINDRYGHGIGDRVLAAAATRMRDSLPAGQDMIARIGGDEFVVLLAPPAQDLRVTAVADRLLSALSTPIVIGEYELQVSASIGAVTTPADTPAAALVDAADRALYRAKARGKDQWVLRALDTGANECPDPMVKCNNVIPESGPR